jgi:ribosome-associated translation inhibitor RaiA
MRTRYRATAKPGRPRGRLARPKTKKSPLAGSLPRAAKRTAGRTGPERIPTFIRAVGVTLSDEERAETRRKLGMKLGKFAPAIERVSVRVADVNGPRGGVDQVCRVKVVLSGLPSVVVENKDATLNPAIDGAVTAAERTVRRTLQRRRMKPRRQQA